MNAPPNSTEVVPRDRASSGTGKLCHPIRQEVTDTLADKSDVEDEIRGLFTALGN